MKNELDKILFFHDLLGDLQELQNELSEVSFDLSPLYFNPQIPQKNFIVPRVDNHKTTQLFFSDHLSEMIPSLFIFKSEHINSGLINFDRDFSYLLELRRHFINFCLYEDEVVELSLKINESSLLVKHVSVKSLISNNLQLTLNIAYLELLNLMKQGNICLKIKVITKGTLRQELDKIISVDKVLQDCRNIFFRLINLGIFNREEEYFTESFKRLKIIPENMQKNEVLNYLSRLSLTNFSHLDFFDWGELLFTFSFKGDFSTYKRKLRIQAKQRIKLLKNNRPWPVNQLISI